MTCSGKESFTSFAFANRVASLSNNRHSGYRMQAYKCSECGCFHVGSKVGRPLDARRKQRFYLLDEEAA